MVKGRNRPKKHKVWTHGDDFANLGSQAMFLGKSIDKQCIFIKFLCVDYVYSIFC
jgi:hypothetical protein